MTLQPASAAQITARMDRLPATRHLWTLVFLISLGGFFEIYDLIFTGYIAPGMTKSGLLQTTTWFFDWLAWSLAIGTIIRKNRKAISA